MGRYTVLLSVATVCPYPMVRSQWRHTAFSPSHRQNCAINELRLFCMQIGAHNQTAISKYKLSSPPCLRFAAPGRISASNDAHTMPDDIQTSEWTPRNIIYGEIKQMFFLISGASKTILPPDQRDWCWIIMETNCSSRSNIKCWVHFTHFNNNIRYITWNGRWECLIRLMAIAANELVLCEVSAFLVSHES